MKIIHYTLGFEPNRSGGLVGYTTDLMNEQKAQGNKVIGLYPGGLNFINKSTYIKKDKIKAFESYQIINSLPLPLFGGIKEPKDFMNTIPKRVYERFLSEISPDIIHIHTLMGIHQEFFEVAKEMDIPLVFTSHDYFGLAPEPTFFFDGESYDQSNTIEEWITSSDQAMSTKKLRIFQFKCYPLVRRIFQVLKKNSNNTKSGNNFSEINDRTIKDYGDLKSYYQNIFRKIDMFHFNSTIAKEVYEKNIDIDIKYKIMSITNCSVKNRSFNKKNDSKQVKVAYIGPREEFKGYFDFLSLAEEMSFNKKFEFHTYGHDTQVKDKNIMNHGRYSRYQLVDIYNNIDILVVPSKWKETFGLVVLEALSHDTAVAVSKNVGAKDLLDESCVFESMTSLKSILINNNWQKPIGKLKTMDEHCKEILSTYLDIKNTR